MISSGFYLFAMALCRSVWANRTALGASVLNGSDEQDQDILFMCDTRKSYFENTVETLAGDSGCDPPDWPIFLRKSRGLISPPMEYSIEVE